MYLNFDLNHCVVNYAFFYIYSGGNDANKVKWTAHGIKSTSTGPSLKSLAFKLPTGPIPRTKQVKTPLSVFQLFITTSLLVGIVRESNDYALDKGVLKLEELTAFIEMNIAMGMITLPQIRDYWAVDEILSTPWFPAIMPRDRFLAILRFLHLADNRKQKNKGEDGYDPLFKVRSIVDHLSAVFPRYYQPAQQLSVDEMMIGTRCRVSYSTYLKSPLSLG